MPGFKQKQPLADCVRALKGHDCTWSSCMSERNSAQNQRIVWCPLRPQLPQVVCLTTKQKLKAKQWGVTFVREVQRSQNPLLTVSLFLCWKGFTFFAQRWRWPLQSNPGVTYTAGEHEKSHTKKQSKIKSPFLNICLMHFLRGHHEGVTWTWKWWKCSALMTACVSWL